MSGFESWAVEEGQNVNTEENQNPNPDENQNPGEGEGNANEEQAKNQNDPTENQDDDDSFDSGKFVEDFKTKNPNASEEDVQKALEEAENESRVIGADLFNEEESQAGDKEKSLVNQFKKIAGDDFDDVEHSVIDSEDDYIEAVNKLVEKRISAKLEESKANETYYSKLGEEGKAIFNAMKMKGLKGVQELVMPDQRFQNILQKPDEDLVIEALKSQKDPTNPKESLYSEEEIERKIAGMDENDIAKEAKIIRGQVQAAYQRDMQYKAQRINQSYAEAQKQEQIQKQQQGQQLEAYLLRNPDFYGLKVDSATAKAVASNYSQGKFDGLLKDPVFLAKAILFAKIGDKAFRRHGKDQYEKGFSKKEANSHNAYLPNATGGSTQRQSQGTGFDSWKV